MQLIFGQKLIHIDIYYLIYFHQQMKNLKNLLNHQYHLIKQYQLKNRQQQQHQ